MNDTMPSEPSTTSSQELVRADRVEIKQGGAGTVEATTVTVEQGGVGRVRAQELSVTMGGVGLARTKSLRLGQGASAFAVSANEAEVSDGANVLVLIARSAGGNVRPLIDWRAAAGFGAGFALVLRVLRRH
jgi:hypothetical protein